MTHALIIQNTSIEGSGNLGRLLESDGFTLDVVHAKKESVRTRSNPSIHDMLIILGGPQSANDDLDYLRDEQELIREYVKQNKPILGICLGSQLIAKAFGAKVLRGPKTEIGFYNDIHLDGNSDSALFSGFTNPFLVFHWHRDTFELPKNAIRLAHSTLYANQAFQLGSAIGVQFHLEVNAPMIRLWIDNNAQKLAKIPYLDPENIRNNINTNIHTIESGMTQFYKNFKTQFNL